jgi:orotate phosphoribosyltransferase
MTVSAPHSSQEIARLTARMLLEINAVHFNAAEPFTLASGLPSPTYIDCRKVISFPRVRSALMDFMCQTLSRDAGYEAFDNIAGGETAGIPFAAWISDRLMLPMQYVRKKAKGFGRNAQIEGDFDDGARILLVEDLTTDGNSKIKFCEALREAGATVDHTFVVFYYDIFPHTRDALDQIGLEMHSLATWWDVLKVAKEFNYFDTGSIDEVEKFLNQPMEWSAAHGGASSLSE